MMKNININVFVQKLLIDHLGFTNELLKANETVIRLGNDKMRDDFLKLIIDVKSMMDKKPIPSPPSYFLGALKNQLISKGFLKN